MNIPHYSRLCCFCAMMNDGVTYPGCLQSVLCAVVFGRVDAAAAVAVSTD